MPLSVEEAKRSLLKALGPGTEDLYDEDGDIGLYVESIARVLKTTSFDLLDTLRKEMFVPTMEQKVPDWEASCGLKETPTARSGTIAQRRNQVLSKLRQHASFSLRDIRAALQPFLLYADPEQIQILEPDRAALRALHTYTPPGTFRINPGTQQTLTVLVADDPAVSPAGFQLSLTVTTTDVTQIRVEVQAPGGEGGVFPFGSLGLGPANQLPMLLCSQALRDVRPYGLWHIQVKAGSVACTVEEVGLFVEALGRNYDVTGRDVGEGLGAALFHFTVVVDRTKLGLGYDLVGAELALQRMTPAHCGSSLLVPSDMAIMCPFPDLPTTIPDISIPC